MADALCLPHKNRNIEVPASRIVAGTPMCAECFAGKEIASVPSRFADASIHTRDDDPEIRPAEKSNGGRRLPGAKTLPVNPEEKKKMPKVRTDLDWLAIQNERSDGVSVADLSKKYRVANSMIYTRTKAPANGNKVAGGGQNKDGPSSRQRRHQCSSIPRSAGETEIGRPIRAGARVPPRRTRAAR